MFNCTQMADISIAFCIIFVLSAKYLYTGREGPRVVPYYSSKVNCKKTHWQLILNLWKIQINEPIKLYTSDHDSVDDRTSDSSIERKCNYVTVKLSGSKALSLITCLMTCLCCPFQLVPLRVHSATSCQQTPVWSVLGQVFSLCIACICSLSSILHFPAWTNIMALYIPTVLMCC